MTEVEEKAESFTKASRMFEESVRNFLSLTQDRAKKMTSSQMREHMRTAAAFRFLGQSFEQDRSRASVHLAQAMKAVGGVYERIAARHQDQPKQDLEPLSRKLATYKGLLATVPDALQVHKSAANKLKDHQKLAEENKISATGLEGIKARMNTINYAVLAEIHHFRQESVSDFKAMMADYLRSQIGFYRQVADDIEGALSELEH